MQTAGADMTPNDLDRKAREPKFGDWLRGVYASERNPIRDGIYVRTCRVNHETCYELTDGKGKFWMYPKRLTERLDRPSVFEEAALRLAVPEDSSAFWREAFRVRVEEQSLLAGHPIAAAKIHADTAVWQVEATIRLAMIAAAPTLADEGGKITPCRCFTPRDKELCLHKRECSVVTAHSDEATP